MFDLTEQSQDPKTTASIINIVKALWDGRAQLANSPTEGSLYCRIGEYWLFFMDNENKKLTPAEVDWYYDIFELAEMIFKAIVNLEKDKYDYCCKWLGLE